MPLRSFDPSMPPPGSIIVGESILRGLVAMRALPLSVLLALAICSSTSRVAAQEIQSGLLDGIEVKDFQGQKVYQSRIEPWPVHDILISAIILEIGTSRRELFLGV